MRLAPEGDTVLFSAGTSFEPVSHFFTHFRNRLNFTAAT